MDIMRLFFQSLSDVTIPYDFTSIALLFVPVAVLIYIFLNSGGGAR